jgi:ubiquitin carboxyl-terminal hydrolase 14
VIVKHQGKRYDVELDPTSSGETFKYQLYSLTGVEPERQKILVKGGQLKDDTILSSLNAKPGQTFMMMGTPSEAESSVGLGRPKETVKFMEDMTDAELAKSEGAIPSGLQNLGDTCYLNSTLQTLRSVPELQAELKKYTPSTIPGRASAGLADLSNFGLSGLGATMDLTAALRDLYKQMSETQDGFPPLMFLNALRTTFPQFAQKARDGHGYAQQDAEEAWSQILTQLREKLRTKGANDYEISFIDKYLAGRFTSVLECDDPAAKEAGEVPVEITDHFLKLDCHIDKDINHLRDGIIAGLQEKIEKHSPALDRDAMYTKRSRIARLPKYLTVHFVRFYWKRESQKKAKIMRKVTFPAELDVVEFCTDELKKRLIPLRDRIREIRKDEEDAERARKRQKLNMQEEKRKADTVAGTAVEPTLVEAEVGDKDADAAMSVFKSDAEYEAERAASLFAAKKELYSLIDHQLAADEGSNMSGLYDLRAVITHKGPSADSGHYTAYVKKQGRLVEDSTAGGKRLEEDGKWWWFNDEKVTEVDAEKIETLAGGGKCFLRDGYLYDSLISCLLTRLVFLGESHSALILLYRAIDLPTAEEAQQ